MPNSDRVDRATAKPRKVKRVVRPNPDQQPRQRKGPTLAELNKGIAARDKAAKAPAKGAAAARRIQVAQSRAEARDHPEKVAQKIKASQERSRPKKKKQGGGLASIDNILSGKATAGVVDLAGDAVSKAAPIMVSTIAPAAAITTKVAGIGKPVKRLIQNGAREIVDIPANAIPAIYLPAKEVVQGRPKEAGKMLAQPFVDLATDPGKSLMEHPVGSALLVKGGEGAVGHGVGKVMRVSPSKKARALASTKRAPAVVPRTKLMQERRYSKDVIVKAGQVAKDKRQAKRTGSTSPTMKPHEIRRRVDEAAAASEDIRRIHREAAVHETRAAAANVDPKAKRAVRRADRTKPSAATTLIVQNAVEPTLAGLTKHLRQLEQAAGGLKGDRLRANKAARHDLEQAIKTFDPVKTPAAARRVAVISVRQQAELAKRGLIDEDQAVKARLIPYAVQRMGARHDGKQIVDHNGLPLSIDDIRADMAARGVKEPGYVSNAPNQRGAKNFFVPTHEAPNLSGAARTGTAVRQGTADLHPDVLTEGAARAQGLVDAADRYAKFVQEFAHRGKTGKVRQFQTFRQAQNAAREAVTDHNGVIHADAVPMRPVRLNAFAGKADQLKELVNVANDQTHPAYEAMHKAAVDALDGADSGAGPWTLVPETAAKQMQDHIRTLGPGPLGRVGNLYGAKFRAAVLTTSPKWLTGNVVEAAGRMMVAHAGPRSYVTGRRVLKRLDEIDPVAGLEAHVRTVGGGHYSLISRQNIHSSAEQFAGTRLAGVAKTLENFWKKPGPKQTAAAWHAYTDFVHNTINGRIETQAQTAMLGKALRDSDLMGSNVVKLNKTAIEEAARGLRDTNAQVALGRQVDRMYGKYGKFSPGTKRMVQAYTPFIAWTLNATQFVLSVLPRDHPVATALLASANQASEEWRESEGLIMPGLLGGESKGGAPGFLQGSIPLKDGGTFRASRYVPTGAFASEGGLPGTYAGGLLPQFSGALANLKGKDWKGKDLPEGESTVLRAAISLVEGSVPFAGQTSRLAKGEGPVGERLNKEFNPFAPTKGKQGPPPKAVKVRRTGPAPLTPLKPLKALPALKPLPTIP